MKGGRVRRLKDFLSYIDTSGKLVKAGAEELEDTARLDRLRRLDRVARSLDERRYQEFARARQV